MFVSYWNNILSCLVGEKSLIICNIAHEGSKTEKQPQILESHANFENFWSENMCPNVTWSSWRPVDTVNGLSNLVNKSQISWRKCWINAAFSEKSAHSGELEAGWVIMRQRAENLNC